MSSTGVDSMRFARRIVAVMTILGLSLALPIYRFDIKQAFLASTWRRTRALMFDVLLLLAILGLLFYFQSKDVELMRSEWDEMALSDRLFEIEMELSPDLRYAQRMWANVRQRVPALLFGNRKERQVFFAVGILEVLGFWYSKIYMESRFELTPGKWLAGIRIRRSSLGIVGFSRVLLRELLYAVDFLFFLTPIPCAISMNFFSRHRQRLGDRISDTIVISAGSIREEENRAE